jgi:hypothetical protein
LIAIVVAAEAQPQPNTTGIRCAAARQLVARQVLRTSPSTYNRYAPCASTEVMAFIRAEQQIWKAVLEHIARDP